MSIPKIIHYCWYGGNKFPPTIKQCIDSWKDHLKGFEFILWNEENLVIKNTFVKYAFENKKWAFISDYVRLKALYEYGGVYLDTDMFIVKEFDKELLENICFFGAENENIISCGVIGVEKKHFFIKKCIEYYDNITDFEGLISPNTYIITKIFRDNFEFQKLISSNYVIDGIKIYEPDYFYPYPFNINRALDKNFIKYATKNTYAIHLWNGSWHAYNEFHHFRRGEYIKGLKKMVINILKNRIKEISYYKKVYHSIRKSFIK